MMASLKKLTSILKSDEGMISVEYGVILSGVAALAVTVLVGLDTVQTNVKALLTAIATKVDSTLPTS
ncbi:MAG: hypothetical protein AB1592_11560 [Pseudomonadota bacterium]